MAQSIRESNDKANYDAACKRLLSERIILAWIMKNCIQEYRNCDVTDIAEKYIEGQPQVAETPVEGGTMIHGTGVEDASPTEGTITYDIRFLATAPATGEIIRLIINVEAQNDFYPGYPLIKRGIYYCSRMISAQHGTEFNGSHYEQIKKVYSIWICMNPPKYRENTITRYHLVEDNLIGEVREPVANYDLITAVMICPGNEDGENYAGILKLLGVLLSTEESAAEKRRILEEDFHIQMTQSLEEEVSLMCNLSKGVEEKGIAKGMAEAIKRLMENMGWSIEEAMSALKIPESDRQEYIAMMKK